jgi:hypothetical protein
MGNTILRPFNALSGQEVKKRILTEIERQLDADYRFRVNVTYPLISWRWKLAATVYPGEPANWEVNVGPVNTRHAESPMPDADAPTVEIDLGGGSDVSGPSGGGITADAARRDAGIAVPSPRRVAGPDQSRVTVDAPVITPQVAASALGFEQEKKSDTNVEKGGRVFARSVTAKTRAAQEGVEVAPAAGTSPTHSAEEIQKVLEDEAKAPAE